MRDIVSALVIGGAWLTLWALPMDAAAAERAPAPRDTLLTLQRFLAAFEPTDTVAVATPKLPGGRARAWQTGLLRADRLQHASLSLASGAAFGVLTREPAVAAGSAMLLGVAKEVRDMRHSRFDWLDLLADAIGAAAATLLTTDLVR
jgi:hypothetical protein